MADPDLDTVDPSDPRASEDASSPKGGDQRLQQNLLLLFILAVFVAVGALLMEPFKPLEPVEAPRIGAKLELAAGEVLLVDEEGRTPLLSATPLPEGATLETGPGARALVRLGDGSRIFMRDGTRVVLGDEVALEQGELWLEVPPMGRGEQATSHRVGPATVRLAEGGASLALREGGAAEVYVADGLAMVTGAEGRAEVKSGQRAMIAASAAPVVEPVRFWVDWTGGLADRGAATGMGGGSGSLYAVDRRAAPGTPSLPLTINRQTVHVVVEDEVAETMVDQRFFNPSDRDVEGWYWFTLPEEAELVSFAVETNGQLVEGEVVERKKAAISYQRAVASNDNPALLEWIDERTARARIYPVPALGERRIVVRYQQLLSEGEGKLRYSYPLAGSQGVEAPTIEEFGLEVQLRGRMATDFEIATLEEARIEDGGRKITMRRSGYTPRADFELELNRIRGEAPAPLRLSEQAGGQDQARFAMLRFAPQVAWGAVEGPPIKMVLVVDTSAGGDLAEHQTKLAVAEALLRSLSAEDQFAIMNADLTSDFLYPAEGLARAEPAAIADALEQLSARRQGGASDLGAIFEDAIGRLHGLDQAAVVYLGDGMATSGERSADALAGRLRRSMTQSRARLFTVGVGSALDEIMLDRLAREGGGSYMRVENPEQAVVRALQLSGHLKTPAITDLELDLPVSLDSVYASANGKLSRGQEYRVLARTHDELPKEMKVSYRLAGEDHSETIAIERDAGLESRLVPRLWAAAYVDHELESGRDPDAIRGKVLSLGLEYGLLTPHSSFLALESEEAYARQGIERRPRPFASLRLTADASWSQVERQNRARLVEEQHPKTVVGMFWSAAWTPLGCSASEGDYADMAPTPASDKAEAKEDDYREMDMEMDRTAAMEVTEEEEMEAPPMAAAEPAPEEEARAFDPDTAANNAGVLGVMAERDGKFLATPSGGAYAVGNDDADKWGGLTGDEVGEDYGTGGLGLVGTGRGGGGTGEGTIGLGNTGLIGKGGGGGTGSGYGRGSGAGFGGKGKRVPQVRQAKATVKGALDKDIIRRIVRAHINEVRACYNTGLTLNPKIGGRIEVEFVIDGKGVVSSSVVKTNTVPDTAVSRCVAKAVKRWKFPKPRGGGLVTVTYPFNLSPDGPMVTTADIPAYDSQKEKVPQIKPVTPTVQRLRDNPYPSPVARHRELPCTDVSARNLATRKHMWVQRLDRAPTMVAALDVFESAAGGCEIKSWRSERVFLQLLQDRAGTEADINSLLGHFWGDDDARKYLSKALLRRLVDPGLIAAVEYNMHGSWVNWAQIDHELALETDGDERLEILRKALERAPGDVEGERRMISLLAELGRRDEAIARGRKLREQGSMTPLVAQLVGELLVEEGREEEAMRLFSEVVEFDPDGRGSRMLLGDVFLRHGWYEMAERQFEGLLVLDENDPAANIRLAIALSGQEKDARARTLLERVASGDGRPGNDDPRLWARLHHAVVLARLLEENDPEIPRAAVVRALKQLQLFEASPTWTFIVTEDLQTRLALARMEKPEKAGEDPIPVIISGDAIRAGGTGLWALEVPDGGLDDDLKVRHAGPVLDRDVAFERITITRKDDDFVVTRRKGSIVARVAMEGETPKNPKPGSKEPEPEPE